ncbi:MAG TPA: NAD(P)-dependent alcohol dehydrogenase [Leptospiraceae bacterium]|nr:NAD(P)-dependent alcohol dehydrogenase [Leptospiraceae bacterium]HMW07985.1 NAD(P)-dependent alcohol dehydrogenase [Leptospiraceae bacterium]HMX34650.1 NAD(P)-dependent alcohol dehydrogenase [Leptospiraceae bacterium]HMY34049.1 NAD(P)-dependent alcohol dehydrogenase [Leptospiraceae bacterium]HMZ65716.1 NAD(P)-dependent alcohol dehydrogenase [Leptospiraceae bacterium]
MKAIQLQGNFGLENLKLADLDEPSVLYPNDVLVRIHAASLNYRDYLVVTGKYNPKFKIPFVPVSDGAGEVLQIGNAVTEFKVGDRVLFQFAPKWLDGDANYEQARYTLGGPLDGTLMEKKVYPESALVKIPDHMSYEEGATLPCAALTSWSSLVTYGRIFAGDTIVVLGTGGVSIFALQIGKILGAKVIVTSGSDEKLEQAKSLGADYTINYKTFPEWGKKVKEITGEGADHIIEVGGAGTLEQSIRAIRPFGQISLIGILAGGAKDLNLLPVLMNNVKMQGILVGSKAGLAAMCKAFTYHKIKPVIDKTFPLEESVKAIEYLKSGSHFGKIVISL